MSHGRAIIPWRQRASSVEPVAHERYSQPDLNKRVRLAQTKRCCLDYLLVYHGLNTCLQSAGVGAEAYRVGVSISVPDAVIVASSMIGTL